MSDWRSGVRDSEAGGGARGDSYDHIVLIFSRRNLGRNGKQNKKIRNSLSVEPSGAACVRARGGNDGSSMAAVVLPRF